MYSSERLIFNLKSFKDCIFGVLYLKYYTHQSYGKHNTCIQTNNCVLEHRSKTTSIEQILYYCCRYGFNKISFALTTSVEMLQVTPYCIILAK